MGWSPPGRTPHSSPRSCARAHLVHLHTAGDLCRPRLAVRSPFRGVCHRCSWRCRRGRVEKFLVVLVPHRGRLVNPIDVARFRFKGPLPLSWRGSRLVVSAVRIWLRVPKRCCARFCWGPSLAAAHHLAVLRPRRMRRPFPLSNALSSLFDARNGSCMCTRAYDTIAIEVAPR